MSYVCGQHLFRVRFGTSSRDTRRVLFYVFISYGSGCEISAADCCYFARRPTFD